MKEGVFKRRFCAKAGFTLIELLVVVLIIGILAAVAVPQYQKAVERSRATQAESMLSAIARAYETYYLANGTYATEFEDLDIDVPFTGDTKFVTLSSASGDTRSNNDWTFQIETSSTATTLYAARIDGKYKGAGFIYFVVNSNPSVQQKQLQCFERKGSARILFDEDLPEGAYCEQVMHATLYLDTSYGRYYRLP